MPLTAGARLGSFGIVNLIGAGGMGEVYRAHDLNLKRDVAIKILPEALAREPDRIARFEREAELLASVTHSNIATIYDFQQHGERHILVMEFVEGDTVADRLSDGPLPLDQAIDIAGQVARALEAAHQRGIVHRDLKPANLKIAADGKVKVLDFGLAKILEGGTPLLDGSNSPTIMGGTAPGLVLGTAAYMSPEQARGLPVDERTDIWALGCVLYEMLTGRPAFASANLSDTLAHVLRGEPDWQRLPDETPSRIRVLLKRCLRKDQRHRLRDAGDARIELDDAEADADQPSFHSPAFRGRRFVPIGLALIVGGALASAFWWPRAQSSSETAGPIHLSLTSLPRPPTSVYLNANHQIAISPDGRKFVYVGSRGGTRQLFLRAIDEADAKLIDGSDGARTAFFSSDADWIAFANEQELKKVAVTGGSPITICKLSSTGFYAGDWASDNTIVFVPDVNGGLWRVSSDGGAPEPLLKTDLERDRVWYGDPDILPDGKGILITVASGRAVTADDQDIAVLPPGSREPRILIRGGSNARYLPTGQLVYARGGALLAVDFDLATLTVHGTPASTIQGLARTWSGDANYAVSDNGTLIYEPHLGTKPGRLFAMVDRKGSIQPISVRGNHGEFSLSPNGRFLATRIFGINDDIWVYDTSTGTPVRLTFEPLDEIYPQWTADGSRIAFGTRTGRIFWRPSDGSGQREELSRGDYPRYPDAFSPDGKLMAFVEIHPSQRRDIWLMPLDGDRRPRPFLATDADEWGARFSPDGQWLAYVSTETGRNEVFIRPIGSTGGRKRVSSEGGIGPEWEPSGRGVFFIRSEDLVRVTLDEHNDPVGRNRTLFTVPRLEDLQFDPWSAEYDVMPDGERFVFGLSPRPSSDGHYNVVLNWFEELKRRRLNR